MPAYDATQFSPAAPVAHVTLRHPETGVRLDKVALLIDSGADVTLIPRESAALVGAAIEPGLEYELLSFDGTSSIAPSVQLDLLFLNRTFKGRFLLIDQDCGVVGRDILNHLSLVLDGPRLEWAEQR